MKILNVILPLLIACGIPTARGEWKLKEHKGQAILLHEWNAKKEGTPSIEGLDEILASRDKSVPLKHIAYWHFNDDPTVQAELLNEFRTKFPELLADAFKSSGNMHNPKVSPLRSKFSECLLGTPTLAQINVALLAQGYTVKRIEFEKFTINKKKKATPFFAFIWLIVEPIANGEAQQAGTGQPATRPESKSEGSDKPQPEAEGRSR